MSNTTWIELQGRPFRETAHDCSTVHHLLHELDILAGKLYVQNVSNYYDWTKYDEVEKDLDDEMEAAMYAEKFGPYDPLKDDPEDRAARGVWFDSTRGLQTMREIRKRLSEKFEDLIFTLNKSTAHWPAQLLEELAHMEAVLAEAVAQGRGFHLLMIA